MTVEFVDTNILVYAHNRRDGHRYAIARDLITRLTEDGTGELSIQVLQEWVNIVTRRVPVPLTLDEAARVIRDFDKAGWLIISPRVDDVVAALNTMQRWQLSWWDALIITAAQVADAGVLWTEDLNHGQHVGQLVVQNPFVATPDQT